MRKRKCKSREKEMQTPEGRHVDLTCFGPDTKYFPTSTAARHKDKASPRLRVSSDHRVALATKAPGNQRLSATKSPRQGHRHRLSRSPRSVLPLRRSFFTKNGVSVPRTSAVLLHTKSDGPLAITKMLAVARL